MKTKPYWRYKWSFMFRKKIRNAKRMPLCRLKRLLENKNTRNLLISIDSEGGISCK